jgi:hypothetical protein
MIVLTVSPVGYSSRGQLFDATIDDRLIVARSPVPFCEACRVLLADGLVTPETPIALRGKTVFAEWQPWKADQMHPVKPSMRQNAEGGMAGACA